MPHTATIHLIIYIHYAKRTVTKHIINGIEET